MISFLCSWLFELTTVQSLQTVHVCMHVLGSLDLAIASFFRDLDLCSFE